MEGRDSLSQILHKHWSVMLMESGSSTMSEPGIWSFLLPSPFAASGLCPLTLQRRTVGGTTLLGVGTCRALAGSPFPSPSLWLTTQLTLIAGGQTSDDLKEGSHRHVGVILLSPFYGWGNQSPVKLSNWHNWDLTFKSNSKVQTLSKLALLQATRLTLWSSAFPFVKKLHIYPADVKRLLRQLLDTIARKALWNCYR